jgi:hypothetical protein
MPQQPELLLKLIRDDVNQGFALPLPLNKIKQLPGILLAPLNIQLQKNDHRARGNHTEKQDDSQSKLEVAVGHLSK